MTTPPERRESGFERFGNDILIIVGLGLTGFGLYLIYPPLTPLVMGLILLVIGLWGSVRKGKG